MVVVVISLYLYVEELPAFSSYSPYSTCIQNVRKTLYSPPLWLYKWKIFYSSLCWPYKWNTLHSPPLWLYKWQFFPRIFSPILYTYTLTYKIYLPGDCHQHGPLENHSPDSFFIGRKVQLRPSTHGTCSLRKQHLHWR